MIWQCSTCGTIFSKPQDRMAGCPRCNAGPAAVDPAYDHPRQKQYEETEAWLAEHAARQREVMLQGIEEKDKDWRDLTPKEIRDNMWEEVVELYKAFEDGDEERVMKAAADVSNFALMLSYKASDV